MRLRAFLVEDSPEVRGDFAESVDIVVYAEEVWTGGIRRRSRGCSCERDTRTKVARVCTLKAMHGS